MNRLFMFHWACPAGCTPYFDEVQPQTWVHVEVDDPDDFGERRSVTKVPATPGCLLDSPSS